MNTTEHSSTCRNYVREQITLNANDAGEINADVVLIDSDTIWGISVGELIDTYLADGTSSCTC